MYFRKKRSKIKLGIYLNDEYFLSTSGTYTFSFGLFKFFCVSRKVEWIKLDMFRLEKILALSLYFCYDQKKNHLHDFTTALSFLIAIKYFQKEEKDSRTAKNINQIKSNQGRTKVTRKFQVRKKNKKSRNRIFMFRNEWLCW